MKKNFIKIFIICLMTVIIISCAKEDNIQTAPQFTASEIESMKVYFESNVMNNSVFLAFKQNFRLLSNRIDEDNPDLSSRSAFSSWVTANFSKTSFNSLNEALFIYDDIVKEDAILAENFGSFFNNFQDKDIGSDDIAYIIGSVYNVPRPVVNNTTPAKVDVSIRFPVHLMILKMITPPL